VGPVGVVLDPPVCAEDLGFEDPVELLDGEQLVAPAGAVGLNPRVLPGRRARCSWRRRVSVTEIAPAAVREGISDKPLRMARESLGVVTCREGFGTSSKVSRSRLPVAGAVWPRPRVRRGLSISGRSGASCDERGASGTIVDKLWTPIRAPSKPTI